MGLRTYTIPFETFMKFQFRPVLVAVCRGVLHTVLKVLVSMLVFTVCLTATLWFLGVPIPGPVELIRSFEGVSELARILS